MGLFTKKKAVEVDAGAEARRRHEIETVEAVLARYPRGTQLHFGAPTRCPGCGDFGFVNAVNRTAGITHLNCFGCHARWVITVEALQAAEELRAARAAACSIIRPGHDPLHAEPASPAAAPAPVVPAATVPPAPVVPVAAHVSPTVDLDRQAVVLPTQPDIVLPPVATPAVAVSPAGEATLRVLVIEDNPFDVAIVQDLVDGLPLDTVELVHAITRAEAEQLTLTRSFDLVLLDLDLPDSTGISTLLEWQLGSTCGAPVVVLSGATNPETVREAQLLGAAQFVHKQHVADLVGQPDGPAKLLRLLRSTIARAKPRV